jgi:23S rRNA (guanosine2251-2'-O)-methyltransferase
VAGNSERRGAKRKTGSKKGQVVGSGGQRRKGLRGKGPTPVATDRPGHPATRRARSATKQPGTGGKGPAVRSRSPRDASRPAPARKDRAKVETVAGRNSVVEALRADIPASALYVAERIDSDDRVREAIKMASRRSIAVLEAPRTELDRLTDRAVHQGIALTVPAYEYAHPDDLLARAETSPEPGLFVALDGVTDPRNLGAVVRSAAGFGAHGVIVPARRSAGMTPSAWKSSAGAAARLPVAQATNLTRTLQDYRSAGVFVVGLDGDGDVALDGLELATSPIVVVVGSEGRGLSRLVRETCDLVVSIPMSAGTESLNAGVAASVALYEIGRRRRTG